MTDETVTTRFAPSPTGYLHLGHLYSALMAEQAARQASGRLLLRIEDIDRGRCRLHFEEALVADLDWLGFRWDGPIWRQSERFDAYAEALARLDGQGLLYPCFCTRREIQAEVAASDGAPQGPDGPLYPGTCRSLEVAERADRIAAGESHALRLDSREAARQAGPLSWHDDRAGRQTVDPGSFGDVILARKDVPTSYHLAVTVDDAAQEVTLVTRGMDLFASTPIHRLLQALLELPEPAYRHHDLLVDSFGKRLAKRDDARSLREMRAAGATPEGLRQQVLSSPRTAADS